MTQYPEELPAKIKKVLKLIDFRFNTNQMNYPFYFALYTEINMRGWNTAHKNLKDNLTKVLELVKEDDALQLKDREKKIRILTRNIDCLEFELDFYSEEFFMAHDSKYLRTVRSLTRGASPMSYRDFRYNKIRELRQSMPIRKVGNKATIPDEETRKMYETYLIDFEKNNYNPNLKEYLKLYRKVNPRNLKRFPIIEVYQFFEGELKLVFKNKEFRKNSLKTDYRFLKNLSWSKAAVSVKTRGTSFGYLAVPDYLDETIKKIKIFSGGMQGGRLGEGGVMHYLYRDGIYKSEEDIMHWKSY